MYLGNVPMRTPYLYNIVQIIIVVVPVFGQAAHDPIPSSDDHQVMGDRASHQHLDDDAALGEGVHNPHKNGVGPLESDLSLDNPPCFRIL